MADLVQQNQHFLSDPVSLPLPPSSVSSLPTRPSILVWLKKQMLTCHQFAPLQPRETEKEGGRKKSLITRKCWRGSGAPVRQLCLGWHTHTHIRSWGNQALRLQPAEDCSRAGQRRSAVSVAAYLPAPGPPLSHPAPDAMIFSLTSCSGCMRKFSHFQSYRLCFGWKQAGQLMSQVQQTFGLSYLKAG